MLFSIAWFGRFIYTGWRGCVSHGGTEITEVGVQMAGGLSHRGFGWYEWGVLLTEAPVSSRGFGRQVKKSKKISVCRWWAWCVSNLVNFSLFLLIAWF